MTAARPALAAANTGGVSIELINRVGITTRVCRAPAVRWRRPHCGRHSTR